ncbi:MAG: aldehyde dehydrogenase family protein [Anaerolineaceae bacterium]|nr:aldehyde dehydrogenase family protein [Anaerolineaceae bacterium]
MTESFKLTYATMFDPPAELHARFEAALQQAKGSLNQEYPMFINGQAHYTVQKSQAVSPLDIRMKIAVFQKGNAADAAMAIAAAKEAFPAWKRTKWEERVRLVRKFADLINERIFSMAAALCLETGKNRMEALGDVAETADLARYACDQMECHNGFIKQMKPDPLVGFVSRNTDVLQPYGVWAVISPFNFPCALTGGPAAAALVAGNTLVIKPASTTMWSPTLLVECLRDAGLPDGVVNLVTGSGSVIGEAIIQSPDIAGITFTGSQSVGMDIFRKFAAGSYVRPAILELGGKNAAIVSKNADLEDAALGIVRSAFGLQGQKCSACSRVFVEKPLYERLLKRVLELTSLLKVGDATQKDVYLGAVIDKNAYADYKTFCDDLRKSGKIVFGGRQIREGEYQYGYFCEPTIVTELPFSHEIWKKELFLPILTIAPVENLEQAIQMANDVDYGLTGGFYGNAKEVEWYFDHIEAGVVYANRPQGASTGAWPGYEPFGGWKGSGSSGKNAGGPYYLQLYMREQSRTLIRRL